MHTGMLWQLDQKKSLGANVAQAASYYAKKYGRTPELCLANPKYFGRNEETQDGAEADAKEHITLRPDQYITLGHLWIGIEEKPSKETE